MKARHDLEDALTIEGNISFHRVETLIENYKNELITTLSLGIEGVLPKTVARDAVIDYINSYIWE